MTLQEIINKALNYPNALENKDEVKKWLERTAKNLQDLSYILEEQDLFKETEQLNSLGDVINLLDNLHLLT